MNKENIENLIRQLLTAIGEDPEREGLKETPFRVAKAYEEMFRGYQPFDFSLKDFGSCYGGIVARIGIPFNSYCEHHMLNFSGVVHFGYIPDCRVVGASKIIRFIQHTTAKLSIQEELTEQLADSFMEEVKPKGCMVIMSASHLCEACRGVKVAGVKMVTQTVRGIFMEDVAARAEFLDIVEREYNG